MKRLRLLCALLATLAQHGATASGHNGRGPETDTALAADALRLPHNLEPDIEESHEWKPNPYVRRRPKQGILFLPKPSTSPPPSYFTPKIASGKRCADDFDCMHVLGQVCKRHRRGSTGNCQCPESTPVELDDEAQPRCVAARRVFEECADTVECSFLNPHVQCINQICTCQPPNILKGKDICVPARVIPSAAKTVGWIVGAIIVVAVLVAIVLGARKLVSKNDADDLMGPTFHSQYWREDRPNTWENVRASLVEMRDKFRSAALGRRDIIGVPGQETRVTTYVPAQSVKPHARHVHQTTVQVDVHRAQSPDEDAHDVIETLLLPAADAHDESDMGPLSPTSRDIMLDQEPGGRGEATPTDAANASRKKRFRDSNEVSKTPQLLFDSESEAERIMSIVLDQLVLERKSLAQAHLTAKISDDETDSKTTRAGRHVGGGQREDDDFVESWQKNTTFDGLQISGIVRSIYSHTLLTLRNKLLSSNAAPIDVDSVDNESYGDSCKPCEEKGFAEGSADLCLAGEMPHPDKGGGEDKSKTSKTKTFSRAVRDHGSPKNDVSSTHLGKQLSRRPGAKNSETTSENKFPPPLMEASLLGSRLDTVLDSCKSVIGPADAAAVDAYPVTQNWTLPERKYTLKHEKNDGCPSCSYQSFSDTSRSRLWKGSRKSTGAPSLFSQSASRCTTDRKGAVLKTSEKLSKAGDTFKSFMSSMYPASLAATSTRSAGCFHTAYSEIPQQSGHTMDHQECASRSAGPRKTQRVHYCDADYAEEPRQEGRTKVWPGRSHESAVAFAPIYQTPTSKAQPGTPGSVTKKRSILKSASSNLGPWTAPKNKEGHEEERPLLLNTAEVPGRGESVGKVSGSDATMQLAGQAEQKDAPQSGLTKQKPKLALANSPTPEASMNNSSHVVGLDKKTLTNESSGASSSKTSALASSASNHHNTILTRTSSYLAGSKNGTKKSPSPKSRASPEQAPLVSENLGSRKEKDGRRDIQETPSTPNLLQGTPDVEDSLPRVAQFTKLNLPFGVHGCDAKGQWSKAVDKQLGRVQTPIIFSVNDPKEMLENNLAVKVEAVVRNPLKSTWSRTSARRQVSPDIINLNITEDELINCINKLVGSTALEEKNNDRQFPKICSRQTPVAGYQLMQDALLYDEAVSTEVTERKGLTRDGKRCSEGNCDALNRPLSSLRRGDLKNMLKEILEEEYSHLLHMSAKVQRDCTTDTKTSGPFSTCENGESDCTSETTGQVSSSRKSVGETEMRDDASTSTGDAGMTSESRSTEQSSPASAMTHAAVTPDDSDKRKSHAEGATTATSSNAGATSTTNTPVRRRGSTNEIRGQATISRTDVQCRRRRATLPLVPLETAPEETLSDGYRLEARKQARNYKASNATSGQGSETTSATTVGNSSSIEHGHSTGAYSVDRQSARLLSDVSIESSSLSKPPQSVTPTVGIADIHFRPQQYPTEMSVPDGEWKRMMAFEDAKRNRVSWSPPMFRTIPDTEAPVFSYADEMVPLPEIKPPIDFSPSASNASLIMMQQDLKPMPASRLVNLSDSYVPFSNWSYRPDKSEIVCEKKAQKPLPESHGQPITVTGHQDTEQKYLPAKNDLSVSARPKSASFHGFSAHHNKSLPAAEAKQRTKSHTDYWLKTVSLYQELTTDQMSSSGVTCSDASGTNTMFEPDQLEALERSKYQNDTLHTLPLSTEGVNPLLETFLRMQNEAPYTPTPRQTSTYGTDSPVERTPLAPRNEGVGSGALFDTSVGDYSLLHRFLASTAPTYEAEPTQWKTTEGSGQKPGRRATIVTDKSVQRPVALAAYDLQLRSRSPETGSPTACAVDDDPSYEDSSATSFSEAKKVKTLRKTAPYRTPFPLCSSSTAASRYNTKAIKKNWNQRMASVAAPNVGTTAMRASRLDAEQRHTGRTTRSETVVPADNRADSPQKSLSALANVDSENFRNYKSLQLHEWLNQAAQYTTFEEGMPVAPLAPAQRFGYQHEGSSTSSEYYEAEPTTETGVPTSQQELTDDPNNWH